MKDIPGQWGSAWYYQRSEGGGQMGPRVRLGRRPNVDLGADGVRLMDLGGDGKLDVVQMRGPVRGYNQRDADANSFKPLRRIQKLPNIDIAGGIDGDNARTIDLTGDGRADLLITESTVRPTGGTAWWYESRGKDGFGDIKRAYFSRDENEGPRVIFSAGNEIIFLAELFSRGEPLQVPPGTPRRSWTSAPSSLPVQPLLGAPPPSGV